MAIDVQPLMRLPLYTPSSSRHQRRRSVSFSGRVHRLQRYLHTPGALYLPILCVCIVFLIYLWARPWAPVWLLSPIHYHSTLRRSIQTSFPAHVQHDLLKALESPSWSVSTFIPNTLFQTDRCLPSQADAETWTRHGFDRAFFDDAQATEWVEEYFGGSEVANVYRELPKPIMFVLFYCTDELL